MTDRVGIALFMSAQNGMAILFGSVLGKILPHAMGRLLPPKIDGDGKFGLLVGLTAMYALVTLFFVAILVDSSCHHEKTYGGYNADKCDHWYAFLTMSAAWFPQMVPLLMLLGAYLYFRSHDLRNRVNYTLIAAFLHVCGFALLIIRILS